MYFCCITMVWTLKFYLHATSSWPPELNSSGFCKIFIPLDIFQSALLLFYIQHIFILQVEHVRAERNLLAEVASHCIVKLYYSFQDAEYLYLIMEYLPGGDLMTLLIREETLTENVARFYVAQSVLAIESIHKHHYIHRLVIMSGT